MSTEIRKFMLKSQEFFVRKPFEEKSTAQTDKNTGNCAGHSQHDHIIGDLRRVEQEHSNKDLSEIMSNTACNADTDL